MSPNIRESVQHLQYKYDKNVDKKPLERLVRAFRKLQELPPDNSNSYFTIAGYHGEPFEGKGEESKAAKYWGGYCFHGNVLFPTWHRAYLLRLEKALQTVLGDTTFSLPYWDECLDQPGPTKIPEVFTSPKFRLPEDHTDMDNPLYSYKLQKGIHDPAGSYTKPSGYNTVRYPLSGLVGTSQAQQETTKHNKLYSNVAENAIYLSNNVSQWLAGTVQIPHDEESTATPDTYSVYSRYRSCLTAPSYTIFSNTTSQNSYNKAHIEDPIYSLESPHNAIHLAVGGFYQAGSYNADPIRGANGDMGDNETAGFDPIFFFHHCFIDYTFWVWQKKHGYTTQFAIDEADEGSTLDVDMPGISANTKLTMNTPLRPFKKDGSSFYTSQDMVDIKGLGYDYAAGSLDAEEPPQEPELSPIIRMKKVHKINRADYAGSFVIRTYAVDPNSGVDVEIGRDPILSRWSVKNCRNCQNRLQVESLVPLDEALLTYFGGHKGHDSVEYKVKIHTHQGLLDLDEAPGNPQFGDVGV